MTKDGRNVVDQPRRTSIKDIHALKGVTSDFNGKPIKIKQPTALRSDMFVKPSSVLSPHTTVHKDRDEIDRILMAVTGQQSTGMQFNKTGGSMERGQNASSALQS